MSLVKELRIDLEKITRECFEIYQETEDGLHFYHKLCRPLSVIISHSRKQDGLRWIHLSLARNDRMPEYREIKRIKDLFIGDHYAYMVFPPADKYVNLHKYCVHMFRCLDKENVLPEFSGVINGLRTL